MVVLVVVWWLVLVSVVWLVVLVVAYNDGGVGGSR